MTHFLIHGMASATVAGDWAGPIGDGARAGRLDLALVDGDILTVVMDGVTLIIHG